MIMAVLGIRVFFELGRFLRLMARRPETRALLVSLVSIVGIGAVFYHLVEGWPWIDAFYFCVVTLATVGYGDFVPTTTAGKLFTMVYILFGIGLFAAFFTQLAQVIIEDRSTRIAERRGRRADEAAAPTAVDGHGEL